MICCGDLIELLVYNPTTAGLRDLIESCVNWENWAPTSSSWSLPHWKATAAATAAMAVLFVVDLDLQGS